QIFQTPNRDLDTTFQDDIVKAGMIDGGPEVLGRKDSADLFTRAQMPARDSVAIARDNLFISRFQLVKEFDGCIDVLQYPSALWADWDREFAFLDAFGQG